MEVLANFTNVSEPYMPVGMWPNDLKYRKSLPGPHPKSRILKGISDSIESNNA